MDIEEYRHQREELDRIEEALVNRVAKSDQYLPVEVNPERNHLGSHTYSARENAFRRQETQQLVTRYHQLASKLTEQPQNFFVHDDLGAELAEAAQQDDNIPCTSEAIKWALNDGARGLDRFCCSETSKLVAEFDYPVPEHFGQQVWLEPFYKQALANKSIPESQTYREFLVNLKTYCYTNHDTGDLETYLMEAYDRAHYLGPQTGTSLADQIKNTVRSASLDAIDNSESDPLWCEFCQHQFANANVFRSHLTGRKHVRNTRSSEPKQKPRNIQAAITLLQPQINETINEIDRKALLTLEDRKLEFEASENDRMKEDDWVSDEEHLNDSNSEKRLTIPKRDSKDREKITRGPDGTPIPRWLFKLQGLRTVFRCEICGNARYAGRRAYDRHFNDARHVGGLAELGIVMSPKFNGINTITEAKDLAAKFNSESNFVEKEVEDEEGNVMGERLYEDLKKQGLI